MTLLLPAGITSFYELPYNVFNAIRQALGFLGFDELEKDDRPDKSIWLDGPELRKHWKMVESRRKARYGGKADRYADEPIDGPVSENAAVKDLFA